MTVPKSAPDLAPVTAATFCHGFVADQNAAVTRALDVTATTPHLLGITPPAGPWRRGGTGGINCTTRDVTRHQTVAVRGSRHSTTTLTETMKRKLKIKIWSNLSVTAELTDARWKKLVGSFHDPNESWADDYESAIETWATTEIPEFMGHLLDAVP